MPMRVQAASASANWGRLAHTSEIESPAPMPRARSARASRFAFAFSSAKVRSPCSLMIAMRSGACSAWNASVMPVAVAVAWSIEAPPRVAPYLTSVPVVTAPVRVCDAGGWTDTWFAGTGQVCNLAVRPGVRVEVAAREDDEVTYELPPTPLVEAAVAEAGATGVHVSVRSMVPPGSSLGTSAAVCVALLAALRVPRRDLATRAHRVETERLGLQSGVQDQAAAAYGGASWIEVAYPTAQRGAIAVPGHAWRDLDERLLTVFLGQHTSSAVHDQVVAGLTTDP